MARGFVRTSAMVLALLVFGLGTGGCKKPRDPANPSEMKEKLATPVGWALRKVDATKDQERQVDRVITEIAPDFFYFQEESKGLTKRILDTLEVRTVDPEAMARLQEAGTQLFDRYMKRVVKAALDVSAILTFEQRNKLIDLWRSYEQGDRIF
jgi:hypothetical protein